MFTQQQHLRNRIQHVYNQAADHFDDAPLRFRREVGQRTIDYLNLMPGEAVLDIGCGSGASALPAAKMVAPGGYVIGVDLADQLLQRGYARADAAGLANVTFRHGDMQDLDFADAQFDAAISVFSVFFASNVQRQIRELWRVLRPGGQLAIITPGPGFMQPLYDRWQNTVHRVRPDLNVGINKWNDVNTPQAVRQLLQDVGIKQADIMMERRSHVLHAPEDWWTIVLGSGMRGTVEDLGPDMAAQVRADNLKWAADNDIDALTLNVIYAIATKPVERPRGTKTWRFLAS